jgi:uncharacterized protein
MNALITGASSGLGREFALQLAREKFGLVLVARREDKLSAVAESARKLGAPAATVIAANLAQTGSAAQVHRKVTEAGIEIDWLINNAGFGTNGRFDRLPLERELEQINLNVTALVALTRMFLPAMIERRRGNIINVASTGAFQAVPWMATYGATKAFVLSFSEALACELRGTGVSVLALCPGPTRTEFQAVANVDETKIPSLSFMDSATVVAQAIAAARRGKSLRINGLMNFVLAEATRIAPRSLTARIAGAMFRNSGV